MTSNLYKYALVVVATLGTTFIGIYFKNELDNYFTSLYNTEETHKHLYTTNSLSKYDGVQKNKIYIALLGSVYDVTKGKQHYGAKKAYSYFAGRDGSRAFITGDFHDKSEKKDHVLDLKCKELFTLLNWRDTIKQKYKKIGKLIGRYFDSNGEQTEYFKELKSRIEQCKWEIEFENERNAQFPACNLQWSVDKGTRVWCSKTSGLITRDWVGVPRQLFIPGEDTPRCVCVNPEKDEAHALLQQYDNCDPKSESCMANNIT